MRKVVRNKWFILAALLLVSLSAFSVVAFRETRQLCTMTHCQEAPRTEKGEMLWDILSRQFSSVSIQ